VQVKLLVKHGEAPGRHLFGGISTASMLS